MKALRQKAVLLLAVATVSSAVIAQPPVAQVGQTNQHKAFEASADPLMTARAAQLNDLLALFRSHYDHATTAQYFARSCLTSRVTRIEVTARLGPGSGYKDVLLTNRPPMNARLYFVWPGVPKVAFHYNDNDILVFINDGIRYWGTPPRDYFEYYGCTNTWTLPIEGDTSQLIQFMSPWLRKLMREQGHNI